MVYFIAGFMLGLVAHYLFEHVQEYCVKWVARKHLEQADIEEVATDLDMSVEDLKCWLGIPEEGKE